MNHGDGEAESRTIGMREQMIAYIRREILIDPDMEIDEDTPLVSTGLVDSFSLVEVLTRLEKITRRRIPTGRVSPQDLETVRRMFETAERVGQQADVLPSGQSAQKT